MICHMDIGIARHSDIQIVHRERIGRFHRKGPLCKRKALAVIQEFIAARFRPCAWNFIGEAAPSFKI